MHKTFILFSKFFELFDYFFLGRSTELSREEYDIFQNNLTLQNQPRLGK